jgi:hypothetical protein
MVAEGDKLIVVGEAQRSGNNTDMAAIRLTDTGALDPEFGTGGRQTVFFDLGGENADVAFGAGLQPGGKVVLGGSTQRGGTATTGNFDFAAIRLGTDTTPNTPPVAAGDLRTTGENTPLVVNVLDNDTDADGDPLTASLVAGPANGTLALNGSGSFTYTPAPGFNGTDSFTYVANDGQANSNPATVTITVGRGDTTPPQAVQARLVRSVVRVGRRRVRVVTLEVAFNEDLNPAAAANPGLYQVAEIAGTRRRPRFRNVAIREASYDAATRVARLTLVGNRPFARGGRLVVQPGVADLAGNALDGNRDGVAGDAATLTFPRQ